MPSFRRSTASSGIRKIFRVVIYSWKNWCKQNVWKAQEWGGMYQRNKNINLNKIQRSNERVAQAQWFIMMVFKTQKVRKFVAFLMGVGCLQCKSSCKKTCWLTKVSPKAIITSKKKVLKCVAFLTSREVRISSLLIELRRARCLW